MSQDDLPNGWKFLTDDVNWESYGGTWCKPAPDGSWFLLRFENKAEWGDGASGYHCEVLQIDLREIGAAELQSALGCCGWELQHTEGTLCIVAPYSGDIIARFEDPTFELVLLDACLSYGIYAPIDSDDSDPLWDEDYDEPGEDDELAHQILESARLLAEQYIGEDGYAALQVRLDRPVNAIGSTARDFGRGDSLAGLRRTADAVLRGEVSPDEVDPSKALMLKMYAATGGWTLGSGVEARLAAAGRAIGKEA